MATKKKPKMGGTRRTTTPRVRRAGQRASRGDARAFAVVLEDIDAKLGGITDQLQLHTEKFEAIDRRFDAMDARFDAMDARFDAMDARFDRLHGDVELLKLATIENTRGIARLEAKTDAQAEALRRLEVGLAAKADRVGS